jgi:DNA-binding transcriptional MerR regulator
MTIGELAARTGLSVRTLRFYADAGVLPEASRTAAGHRVFGPDAVTRGRLVRTLRELGVGLDDIARVLRAETSLADVAAAHACALDLQIRSLRLQRAVLRAVATLDAIADDARELERMTDLTTRTAAQRRQILDDYLDGVFGDDPSVVADRMAMGAPDLPDDPTPEQVAAWVELAELLQDPDFVAASRRMADRARAEGPDLTVANLAVGRVVVEAAGTALRSGLDPRSPGALPVLERIEAVAPEDRADRVAAADRIDAFTDRRVSRYWTLVGIVNGWSSSSAPAPDELIDAWQWYAEALRSHA